MIEQFKIDVSKGLSSNPKFLLSKYFYDERGSKLFVEIMNAPEYYLTNAEHEILRNQAGEIVSAFGMNGEHFELVELGAGDGTKTLELLRALEGKYVFDYMPIDISQDALDNLEIRLQKEVPGVTVKTQHGMYFAVLDQIKAIHHPMVILFLGSNLGNMVDEKAHDFMAQLAHAMTSGDKLLLGVDLKKSKDIVLPAYNDAAGITSQFNLNLLRRINQELGANFLLEQFEHAPKYDEETGIAESYLKSLVEQEVFIADLNKSYHFSEGELIHMEISRKYDEQILEKILSGTGLRIKHVFQDSKNYFADFVLEKY